MAKLIIQMSDESYLLGPEISHKYEVDKNTGLWKSVNNDEIEDTIVQLNKFIKKYKDLHEDIHQVIWENDNYLEINLCGVEILLPEESNNVFAKLLASDIGNKRGPGFGLDPFPDKFYQDLFNILDKNGIDGMFRGSMCGNFDGYYNFGASLEADGIHWNTEYYEEADF